MKQGSTMEGELNLLLIIWESGFVVKMVLLLLIAMSVISWAIIYNRSKFIKAVEIDDQKFDESFQSQMGLAEIYQVSQDYPNSTLSLMYKYGFEELKRSPKRFKKNNSTLTLADFFTKFGMEPLERALKKGVVQSNEKLNKLLVILASIGSISPFVGLFGTVWGIINSFTGLSSGGGTIEAVAPGIAEALVATAVGLAAAIPAVWFYNIFNNRIQSLNNKMEAFGEDYINMISRSVLISKDDI
jgi:biopolymer transport protein TolQ